MKKLLFVLALLFTACGGNSADKKILADAARIHNEMMELAEQLETKIDGLQPDSSQLPADTLANIRQAFSAWESDVVEVPGNEEHHHEEGEEHHHEHKTVEVTAQQMLTIQTELNRRLLEIQSRVDKVGKQ